MHPSGNRASAPAMRSLAMGKPGSHTPRQVRDVSRVNAVSDEQSLNDRVRQGVAHRAGDPFASRYLVATVRMHRMLLTQGQETGRLAPHAGGDGPAGLLGVVA